MMLDSEDLIALNQSAQIVPMVTVEMTQPAFARLDGKARPAPRRLARWVVKITEASATKGTACALLDCLVWNVQSRPSCAPMAAVATEFVMSGARCARAMKGSRDSIARLRAVVMAAMSLMVAATTEPACVPQASWERAAKSRPVPETAWTTECATPSPELAIASQAGLDMTVDSKLVLS